MELDDRSFGFALSVDEDNSLLFKFFIGKISVFVSVEQARKMAVDLVGLIVQADALIATGQAHEKKETIQ